MVRKCAYLIVQLIVTLTMNKICTQFHGYYGIGRVRTRQSEVLSRKVCGVQSYDWYEDPVWVKTLRPVGSYSVRWALDYTNHLSQ